MHVVTTAMPAGPATSSCWCRTFPLDVSALFICLTVPNVLYHLECCAQETTLLLGCFKVTVIYLTHHTTDGTGPWAGLRGGVSGLGGAHSCI